MGGWAEGRAGLCQALYLFPSQAPLTPKPELLFKAKLPREEGAIRVRESSCLCGPE